MLGLGKYGWDLRAKIRIWNMVRVRVHKYIHIYTYTYIYIYIHIYIQKNIEPKKVRCFYESFQPLAFFLLTNHTKGDERIAPIVPFVKGRRLTYIIRCVAQRESVLYHLYIHAYIHTYTHTHTSCLYCHTY